MDGQLTLFDDIPIKLAKKVTGGSHNPIVFYDYESFVAKFADKPKTTDDCYTPQDVYEAVVRYVGTIIDLTDKVICRPFYPGGDYENAEYPENGVVIDNPPFSIFSKIVRFYTLSDIPFFLFGPGMTITICCKWCTAVISGSHIKFGNGALVRVNFASNLYGDSILVAAPSLESAIRNCPSQIQPEKLPKYNYPVELISINKAQQMAQYGVDMNIKRSDAIMVTTLDNHAKDLYGVHLLVDAELARAKDAELARAKDAELARAITIELSERERRMLNKL